MCVIVLLFVVLLARNCVNLIHDWLFATKAQPFFIFLAEFPKVNGYMKTLAEYLVGFVFASIIQVVFPQGHIFFHEECVQIKREHFRL